MASFHDAQEFRDNQGEDEGVDVISAEPIAMIVLPELQDSPRTATSESSASSSAGGATEVVVFEGWESKVLSGRLDNLHKAPKTLPAGFRFRVALHHEVADGAATVKGYKKLEQMVRRFQIPRTILIRAGTPNERACSVSRTGWVLVYVDHFDADLCFPLPELIFDVLAECELALSQLTPNSIKFIIGFMLLCERLGMPAKAVVFRSLFLCRLCSSTSGTRWYYISGREKMMIFTNIRNKLTSGDVDLKNWLLDYVKAKGLVDLEALATRDQIALLGRNEQHSGEAAPESTRLTGPGAGVGSWGRGARSGSQRQSRFDERPPAAPGRSSQHRSSSLVQRPRAEQRVELTPSNSRRRAREEFDAEDDVPLIQRRTSTGSQPAPVAAARLANVPQASVREVTEAAPASSSVAGPRIAYPDGFSYVRTECQTAMLQGMHNFVPPAERLRAKGHIQQHGRHAALIKLMDAFSYTVVLFQCDSEMANRAASAESRADELARKVDELKEEFQRAQVEKDTGIQAAKEELGLAEERARKAESEKEKTLHELSALRERVSQADQHVARAEASLEKMFQDAVVVAFANTTTDIFNEVRGKVLGVRADFPIGELAFFEGEEIDNEGKSLAPSADTRVRLKWELNEEGLPIWPPSIIEEGEDTEGLPSFDAWVADPHDVRAEPSSTPPSA
ncbi:hypothetical protein SLEP1_g55386 [Rubroshorea leprosula]|uniref:Transposase (putative) gypsy type domain-containing protein n=1 Tax=Rubroshorea leprosula TaxID=152421 RepID=A0AAV5MGF2_9ROSI|nr:hypothetical protein SLEP1_g55386 [Rubroshorea leprosula]